MTLVDAYSKFERVIDDHAATGGAAICGRSFWDASGAPDLDLPLLESLITRTIRDGDSAESGALARALDMWIAEELRAAGFAEEGVWLRLREPRVLDPSVGEFVEKLPKKLAKQCRDYFSRGGSATASVQGAVYQKQIDVGMSSWLAGPEILISTKTMSGSYGKNLANRFEEAYGDAMNLRKRYPLAAIGFFFLVDYEIASCSSDLSKAILMLRKLHEEDGAYDATALLLVDWSLGRAVVPSQKGLVPESLSAATFFSRIVNLVLLRGSVARHERAYEKANVCAMEL